MLLPLAISQHAPSKPHSLTRETLFGRFCSRASARRGGFQCGSGVIISSVVAISTRCVGHRHRRIARDRSLVARAGSLTVPASTLHPSSHPTEPFLECPSQLPQLSVADQHKLRNGVRLQKQERDGARGSGFVVVDVAAPRALVLDCLSSFEDYPDKIPVVRHAKVKSRVKVAKGITSCSCDYKISRFELGISAVHNVDLSNGIVRFGLDPTYPRLVLREATGFWYVEPTAENSPGRTRVWLYVGVHGSRFLPHWLLAYAAERALRRATAWLRPHVEGLWHDQQTSSKDQQQDFSKTPTALQQHAECWTPRPALI